MSYIYIYIYICLLHLSKSVAKTVKHRTEANTSEGSIYYIDVPTSCSHMKWAYHNRESKNETILQNERIGEGI